MQILKTVVDHNYRCHPAFKFKASSWEAHAGALAAFNQGYEAARNLGATLNKKSFAAVSGDCQQALQGVFSSIGSQCADEFETQFLAELKNECVRLLNEELAWYAKRRLTHFVEFIDPRARQDAIRMQNLRHYFGVLPQAAVDEIRSLAEVDLGRFRSSAVTGKLTRDDLSANGGATVRAIRDVLNREFKALGVLDAVSAYTGRKTRVTGLALELSVPQATWWRNAINGLDRPPKTLYAHLDEGIAFPKSIVYLSDVTEQNGPTGCYPDAYEAIDLNPLQEMIGRVLANIGNNPASVLKAYYAKQYHQSASSENFRRHFMRLPEALRFNSHLGWDVLPGGELEEKLADGERKMTGPAGTFIVFDGARLLHRGGLMQEGERVALQVIFSDLTLAERAMGKLKRMLS